MADQNKRKLFVWSPLTHQAQQPSVDLMLDQQKQDAEPMLV